MAKVMPWGETLKVLLDAGFTANGFALDYSTLNGPNVLDGNTEFVDVTEWVLSVGVNRGRTDVLRAAFQPGVCQIVLDDRAANRAFDPANTASPYYEGDLGIAPRRFVEVYGGTAGDEALFVGRVQDLDIEYQRPNLSTCTIVAVDDLADFAKSTLTGFNPSQQLTSARVSAILDRPEVAYSTATRAISTGVATLGTFAYEAGKSVAAALQEVAESEGGRFFVAKNGFATFQPRTSFTFSTAVVHFSDSDGGSVVPYQSLDVGYGAETLWNSATVTTRGGAVGTALGTASITQYGISDYAINDLPLLNATEATSLAQSIVDRYEEPVSRFNQIGVTLNGLSGANIEALDSLDVGSVVKVSKSFTTGSPTSITQNVFIERIGHQISPQAHTVVFGLGEANLLTAFILDTSQLDAIGVGLG
jgi:hypothetical protein